MSSLYKYEFDRLGTAASNRVVEEPKSIALADPKAIYSTYGVFYTEGVLVTDASRNSLTLGTDYEFISDDPFVTAETGKETASGIRMTDDNFVGDLLITYQAVGGPEGQSSEFAKRLAQAIEDAIANPNIQWANIRNKPVFYPPALHRHAPSQLDDLGLLSQRLDEVTLALRTRRPLHDSYDNVNENYERLLRIVAGLQNSINQIVAVAGSAQILADIQERLDNVQKELNFDGEGINGLPITLWSAPEGSFSFVSGAVVFKAGVVTQVVQLDIVHNDTNVEWSRYGDHLMGSATDAFTLSVTQSGGQVRLIAVPALTGNFKVKWNAEI